jgi:hypothetical protein
LAVCGSERPQSLSAGKLDELRTLAGQIQQQFYEVTLPWSDEGVRLLPAHFYFDLATEMRVFGHAFESKAEELLAIYPSYIEQVRQALNALFREEDYPSVEKLRKKFRIKLEVHPIPTGVTSGSQCRPRSVPGPPARSDANVRQSRQRGTEDLWSRMKDVVSDQPHFRQRDGSCSQREAYVSVEVGNMTLSS